MEIDLRGYQKEAIDTMFGRKDQNGDEIIQGLYDDKNFAAVFLPTGGGKSFVSMEAMLRTMVPNEGDDKKYVISKTPMLYLSPNTPIIEQFQIHMSRYIIFEHHISQIEQEKEITRENVAEIAREILTRFSDKVKILDDEYEANEDENAIIRFVEKHSDIEDPKELLRTALKAQLSKQDSKVIRDGVKKAFPGFKPKCYQAMRSRKDAPEDLVENDADKKEEEERIFFVEDIEAEFTIIDEAHRGAAKKWGKYLELFAKNHKKSKMLAITATPDRDEDDYSIIEKLAKYGGYSQEEIRNGEYIAKYLELIEAMDENLVVTPNIVRFNCTLDQTGIYREIKEKIKELSHKHTIAATDQKTAYEAIIKRMDALCGRPKGMSDSDWEIRREQIISDTIRLSDLNPNGKCIGFIPQKPNGADIDIHLNTYEKRIRETVDSAFNLPGAEEKVPIFAKSYYHSLGDAQNAKVLRYFNGAETDSGGLKIIITNKKLNEGVHVDNTEGLFMYDEIHSENAKKLKDTPKIRFLQQIGRCITSIDQEHPELTTEPNIYDFAHNFMWQHHLLRGKDGTPYFSLTSEEAEFMELCEIFKQGIKSCSAMPKDPSVRGVYDDYIRTGIIKFKMKNGEEIRFPTGKYHVNDNPECSGVRKDQNLKYNSKGLPLTEVAKLKYQKRFDNIVSILKLLEKAGIDVSKIDDSIVFSEEFLDANNIVGRKREELLNELFNTDAKYVSQNIGKAVYPLGNEIKLFKQAFYGIGANSATRKIFAGADFSELRKLGITYIDLLNIPEEFKEIITPEGFIVPFEKIEERYWGFNVETGSMYRNGRDEFGLDEEGYDVYGYDKDGFNREGIHKLTGQDFDERFFKKQTDPKTGKIVWINTQTNTELDKLGFNHEGIDPETGFDRGIVVEKKLVRLWHEKTEKGFSRLGRKSNSGINQNGFKGKRIEDVRFGHNKSEEDQRGFYVDGTHKQGFYIGTSFYSNRNREGYDIDGYDMNWFNSQKIHRETSYEYGPDGKNVKGELHPDVKLANDLLKDIMQGKMSETEIYKKYSEISDIDSKLNNAMTVYAMSPKLKLEYSENQLLENIEGFDVVERLSPKLKSQLQERTRYRNAVIEELETKRAQYKEQGKELENEEKRVEEKLRQVKSSIIVREFDEGR